MSFPFMVLSRCLLETERDMLSGSSKQTAPMAWLRPRPAEEEDGTVSEGMCAPAVMSGTVWP